MRLGWLFLVLASLGNVAPAHAQSAVSACLPESLEPALRDALALELGPPIAPCESGDSPGDTLRIAIEQVSPVTPLTIEVSSGARRVSGRTAQPADVMGPRAIAVVVHSLIDELVAPAAPIEAAPIATEMPTPAAPAGYSATGSAAPDSSAASSSEAPESARPMRLILGITGGFGFLLGWGDLVGAGDPEDSRSAALSVGIEARLHATTGHGATLAGRLATFWFTPGPIVAVDLRYSYRLGFAPGVDVLGGAMFLEIGVGAIRGIYMQFRETRSVVGHLERVGIGPTAALVGVVHLGPITLGLDITYFATINPWGSRELDEDTGRADRVTFASDFDIGLRAGSHLPL